MTMSWLKKSLKKLLKFVQPRRKVAPMRSGTLFNEKCSEQIEKTNNQTHCPYCPYCVLRTPLAKMAGLSSDFLFGEEK